MNKKSVILIKKYMQEIYFNNIKKSIVILFLSVFRIGIVLIPPIFIMKIMDSAIPDRNYEKIVIYISIVLLFTIVDAFSNIVLEKCYALLGKKVFMQFQKRFIEHLLKLNGSYFGNSSTGEKFTTIVSDIFQVKNLTSPIVFGFISDTVTAIVMLVFLSYIQLDLIIIVFCILPVIYFSQLYFQRRGKEISNDVRDAQSTLNGVLEAIVSNTISCILCNGASYFFRIYDDAVEEAESKNIETRMIFAKNSGILSFFATFFTILILGFGGMKVIQGSLTIGGLIAFNMYAQKLVIPILKISNVMMTLQGVLVSLERMEDFWNVPEIKEADLAMSQGILQGNNTISFESISFAYEKNAVIEDVSLVFKANNINVIVGESGCGKSTLTLLLYRVWDATSGAIKINSFEHRYFNIKYLRDCISVVSQDTYLFYDTIFNNIAMNENTDREFVQQCARIAGIHDFIMTLPNQYDSMTGDRGIKLSGGEKQRICLARALVRNTPILILDEATSALDQLTEKLVLENLKQWMRNKTIIIITHRLHSVEDADVIYLMQEGRVTAQGTHKELMVLSPYYKQMVKRDLKSSRLSGGIEYEYNY